jgi:hypothetical protein
VELRTVRWLGVLLGLAGTAAAAMERTPVLVELFTSEGCSSCPVADEALAALATEQPVPGALVVPLELHVDYWNELGWADPFSLPEATARQEHHATAGAARGYASGLYTPEMVVDGTRSFVGNRRLALEAITQALGLPKRAVRVEATSLKGGIDVKLQVSAGDERTLVLWLALTEAGLSSQVTRGENRGRRLVHAPVARLLEELGHVSAAGWAGTVRLAVGRSWQQAGLAVVAFVEEKDTGRVVGVGTCRVAPAPESGSTASVRPPPN